MTPGPKKKHRGKTTDGKKLRIETEKKAPLRAWASNRVPDPHVDFSDNSPSGPSSEPPPPVDKSEAVRADGASIVWEEDGSADQLAQPDLAHPAHLLSGGTGTASSLKGLQLVAVPMLVPGTATGIESSSGAIAEGPAAERGQRTYADAVHAAARGELFTWKGFVVCFLALAVGTFVFLYAKDLERTDSTDLKVLLPLAVRALIPTTVVAMPAVVVALCRGTIGCWRYFRPSRRATDVA